MKDFLKNFWPTIFLFLLIVGCAGSMIYSSYQKKIEREHRKLELVQKELEQEKEKRRIQHIEDSIKATPEYIDSVRRSKEFYAEWEQFQKDVEEEEIVGYVYSSDTVYHNAFHSVHLLHKLNNKKMSVSSKYLKDEEKSLRFVSGYEVKSLGLKLCEECDEIISAYREYEDGELIRREDAKDYIDDDFY